MTKLNIGNNIKNSWYAAGPKVLIKRDKSVNTNLCDFQPSAIKIIYTLFIHT